MIVKSARVIAQIIAIAAGGMCSMKRPKRQSKVRAIAAFMEKEQMNVL